MHRLARPIPVLMAVISLGLSGCGISMPRLPRVPLPSLPHVSVSFDKAKEPKPDQRDRSFPDRTFNDIGYATWSDDEPPYRFYPGDEIEVSLPSAPELNKTVIVQPDGRISMPLIAAVMAADKTIPDLQYALSSAYSTQLLRPAVDLNPKAAPLKVFVGGEVGNPGIYEMAGDADALRAIIQAGDFKTTGDRRRVIIIRRGGDGRGMQRTANLGKGLKSGTVDLIPLRRFDIVYVPRTGVANANLFIQQYFRDLSPLQLGFSYALGNTTTR